MASGCRWATILVFAYAVIAGFSCRRDEVNAFPDSYVGVGVELSIREDRPTIIRVIDGGPAAAAGLKPGTVLLEIAGEPTTGKSLATVVDALRGPPDSEVTVRAQQGGEPFNVRLVRRALVKGDAHGQYKTGSASR